MTKYIADGYQHSPDYVIPLDKGSLETFLLWYDDGVVYRGNILIRYPVLEFIGNEYYQLKIASLIKGLIIPFQKMPDIKR